MESIEPKLRFPEFTDNWSFFFIGEICEIKTGNKDTQNKKEDGEYPFFVRSNTVEKIDSFSYDGEAILTSGDGVGVGKNFHYINGKFDYHQRVYALLNFKKEFNGKFIYQVFSEKFYKRVIGLSAKNSVDSVRMDFISKMSLGFPSIVEQTKIASFLIEIDTKINQLTQKKDLLEKYKKGIMQKIFNQEIRFKDENGKDYKKWEEKSLGEIGSFQTSSIDKLIRENEDKVFLVNYMNVYKHQNINNKNKNELHVVTATENQISTCDLKRGDILFTPSSETPDDIGHSVVIFEDLNNCVYSYHLMRFRPKIEIDILFSHYFCNIQTVLSQISKLATGSTRYTISVKSFSSIIVNLPCLEEQTKIANFLSAIDDKINHVAIQLDKTKEYKKGLLQQMFV